MLVEISDGEILDRLSILEIKSHKIKEESRLLEVKKEIESLTSAFETKSKFLLYYRLIYYINELIWKKTDEIKLQTDLNSDYAKTAYCIFELNQQRFRIKDIINNLSNSSIKEQKSYFKHTILYVIDSTVTLKDVIRNCIYLLLNYDSVLINCSDTVFKNELQRYLPSLKESNENDNVISDVKIPDDILCEINKIIDSIQLL